MTRRASRRRRWVVAAALLTAAVAAACGSGDDGNDGNDGDDGAAAQPAPSAAEETVDLSDIHRPLTAREEGRASLFRREFKLTDFTTRNIDLDELLSGGPGKDGIPAIDEPQFVTAQEGDEFLDRDEPVIALEVNGEARAYPLQILIWHEIANDTVGGVPVTVTFCPLCNTAITFDRRIDGEVRTFGVSGLLRESDLVMYDRTNESLWQQITGEAIVGVDTGKRLTFIASQIVSWGEFRETFPDALVLSRDTGHSRSYGQNPYFGYDRIGSATIFPVDEFDEERLDGKERVLTVEIDGDAIAFPFSELSVHVVLDADIAGQPVVAFWQPGALSSLDEALIIGSRNVGAAGAFSPFLDGERLTFEARDQEIVDAETGSVWNVLGRAVSGPLEGTALEPVVSANHFWFSWAIFQPDTRVIRAGGAG